MQKREQINQIVNTLKYKFFKVIYLILKQWSNYKWMTIIVCLTQYLQYTYLNFGLKVQYVWRNKAYSDIINLLLKYFTITISVKNLGIRNYLTIFYFCLGLVLFTILLILLLAFVIKNKKLQRGPLILLRVLLKIILTFGFWPIVRMQFGLLACEYNKKGKLIMMFEQTQECWTSDYYIHAVIAIIGLIITLTFSMLMVFVTYESRSTAKDANAMRNGRSYYQLLIYIFTQIMTYQLLATPEYTILIIAVFLIGSSIVFINTHIAQPYYDTFIQKMWSILAGVNFWTILMMFYSYTLDGKTFTNTIQAWLLGIPLIIGILIFRQREYVDLMKANLRKFQDGTQVIKLCEYLLHLIKNQHKSQRNQLLIDSYIEIHKIVCHRNDCIVKIKEEMANKFKENPKYTNRNHITNELITQIYQESIKQFPEDIQLRLSYVYFLYDHKKSYSLIMSELIQALEFKPTFDYEFHIYRYKQIIEEESQQKEEQFDRTNSIKQSQDLIDLLEQTTLQIIDFWISMTDDHPDMNKLMNYGFKILKQKEEIDLNWSKLKKSDSLKLYNLMAKFYLLVLDDQEISDQIQNQLRLLQKIKQLEVTEIEEVSNKSIPTLIVTAQFSNFRIQTVNKALCSLLGYSKTDLIGRSINQVIPELYADPHDCSLELFIENQSKYQKEFVIQTVYLLAKNNYIIPVNSNVKLIQTNNNQLYFIAQYQQSFSPKQQCFLLLDIEGYIENITSTCILLLRLDIIKIKMRRINIKELFPDFHSRKQEFFSKSGSKLHLAPHGLKYSTKTFDTVSIYEQIDFQCYLNHIQFPCLQNEQKYGIIMKLEQIKQHNNNSESFQKLIPQCPRRTKFPIFQYIPPSVFYLDYLSVTEIEESMDIQISQNNEPKLSKIVDYFRMVKRMSQSQKRSLHYDDGIKIKRLWDGQILDIEYFNIDQQQLEEEEEEEQLSAQKLINEKDKEMQEFQHYFELFQSKSSMNQLLMNSRVSKGFKILNYLVSLSLFTLYISGMVVFIFNLNDDANVQSMIFNLSLNNKRLSSCLMIQTIIQDIRLLNYGKQNDVNPNYDQLFKSNLEQLNQEIQDLIEIHKSLSTAETLINKEYSEYYYAYFSQNIQLQSIDGSTKNYTYKEAIDLLIGKALYLNSSDISKFNDSDIDFFFYNYNTINSVSKYYQIPLNYRYYSIKSVSQNSLDNKLIFLILQTLIQFVAYILIALYLIQMNIYQHQIYELFFEVNQFQIKNIIQKCESFLSLLNVDDEQDDIQEEKQLKQTFDQDENKMMNKKQLKVWKNRNKKFKKLMVTIFFIFALIEAYFIFQYVSAQGVVETTFNLSPILNATSLLESEYRLGDNAIREYFINPNQSIYCNPYPFKFINNYFIRLYEVNADIQTKFTQNLDLFQPDYIQSFQELLVTQQKKMDLKTNLTLYPARFKL